MSPKIIPTYGAWGMGFPGMPTPAPKKEVEVKNEKGTGNVNFCKPDMMSVCTAGKIWNGEHARCKYARKSSYSNRCMHFVIDGNCDSVEAQRNK